MGTRADFYLGRGQTAQYLGSIAWDGYPDGNPIRLLPLKDKALFLQEVQRITTECDHGTTPEQGWPWPWENSATTDYAYAFDEDQVWVSCFGGPWHRARDGRCDSTICRQSSGFRGRRLRAARPTSAFEDRW